MNKLQDYIETVIEGLKQPNHYSISCRMQQLPWRKCGFKLDEIWQAVDVHRGLLKSTYLEKSELRREILFLAIRLYRKLQKAILATKNRQNARIEKGKIKWVIRYGNSIQNRQFTIIPLLDIIEYFDLGISRATFFRWHCKLPYKFSRSVWENIYEGKKRRKYICYELNPEKKQIYQKIFSILQSNPKMKTKDIISSIRNTYSASYSDRTLYLMVRDIRKQGKKYRYIMESIPL